MTGRHGRLRDPSGYLARAALVVLAGSAPLGERAALAQARAALARCPGELEDSPADQPSCGALVAWDVDADGVRLVGIERELAGARWSAEAVHVGLDRHGIAVDVDRLGRAERSVASAAPTSTAAASASSPKPTRIDLHGVPATLRVHGELALPLSHGVIATVSDPTVTIDAGGTPRASATAHVELPRGHEVALADAHVEPGPRGGWRVAAEASIDGGPVVTVAGELAGGRLHLRAVANERPGATLEITGDRDGSSPWTIRANEWPLATVGPRIAARLGDRGVALDDTTLGGEVELTLGPSLHVRARELVIDGARIDDPRLATRPVRFAALQLDGEVTRTADGWQGEADVTHRDAQVHARVGLVGSRLQVAVELAELPCQDLLHALPDGMADAIAGARASGSIAGSAVVVVELDRLASVDLDVDAPPGTLAFEFPFLESCRTTADPAGIDLAGLEGPYRHVFVAGGRRHDRVLAAGAPGFVPLARGSRIAAAFVALEDMRFRSHDGFDREQIERAFWHNLVAGGVRRGASTISQQAARNLWLGVDRSLARKLQEAWLTARLEEAVDKDRILELYVNLIELGPGVFGIDEGARYHFGVAPEDLDVLQAVHLAALAPAPRTLSKRFANGEVDDAWLAELRDHARRMHRNGMITAGELWTAQRTPLRLRVHTGGSATADAAP